jgi:hypothetical protein
MMIHTFLVIHFIVIHSTAFIVYLFVHLSFSFFSSLNTTSSSTSLSFTMTSKLKPNDSTATINEFLAQVRISNFHIHLKLVEFNDAKDRQRKITFLHNKLIAKGLPKDAAQSQSEELVDADVLLVGIELLTQKGLGLMLAGQEQKDFGLGLSLEEATTHVMLVFLKERKVSNLSSLYYSNANNLYSSTSMIQTLKQPILVNSQKKRKKKWQLKRETRRIGALDLVRSLVVLDFAICTKESKANSQ